MAEPGGREPPPSLLSEADPRRHDAPRRVSTELLGPRAVRRLCADWHSIPVRVSRPHRPT